MIVASVLFDVAANVLTEAGMTHTDIADLLETLARLSREQPEREQACDA